MNPLRPSRRSAFSLVEMLVVVAIIGILIAVALPAINGIQGGYNLDAASQAVIAQLNLARQTALATSHPVEVRFYQLPDYHNSATTVFRAMQSFSESDSATVPIAKPYFFSPTVKVFQVTVGGTDVSSLLTQTFSSITPVAAGDPSITANPLPPPYGTTYSYSYFHFRANGQTDLSFARPNSLLTLALETAPLSTTGATSALLPNNYVTLQINAITGSVGVYRP